MTDFKIVFVHGYKSSSKADWYPQLGQALYARGVDYIVPDLPGDASPHAQTWLDILNPIISQINKKIVLVGHSLGTRAILLYLEKYHPRVDKVFLIAPFSNNVANGQMYQGAAFPDFFDHKIDLQSIKPNVGKFIVMQSTDDTHIEFSQGQELASDLNAELVSYSGLDHLSDSSNAPLLLQALQKELDF